MTNFLLTILLFLALTCMTFFIGRLVTWSTYFVISKTAKHSTVKNEKVLTNKYVNISCILAVVSIFLFSIVFYYR